MKTVNQSLRQSEARAFARKNMFLGAVLRTPTGNCPAKIRNMSETGAFLEAPILPSKGTPVRLVRGSLDAVGQVVWSSGNHCGVAFSAHVCVQEWLPDRHKHQSGVDALLEQVRSGGPDWAVSASTHPTTTLVQAANTISELIRALDHELAGDPSLVSNHASALQAFDLAVQALDAMVLSAEGGNCQRLADALAACRHLMRTISAGSAPATRPTIEPN